MEWSAGFTGTYYMTIVEPVSWRDTDRVEILGGGVSRTSSGLRQSADIDCVDFDPDREQWVRVYMEAAQPGDVVRVPLFTGLSSSPERDINGSATQYPLACYSVLKPADDVLLDRGWYILSGSNGAEAVADLLSVTPAPVTVESGSPKLLQTIIAQNGETHLSMVNRILEAINWRLIIAGDGSITIVSKSTEEVLTLGIDYDIVEPQIQVTSDWFGCPNVFRAVSGDETAIARDDDINSMLSTASRGREIWAEDTNCKLNDGEGLSQYAERRLAELQSYAYSIRYNRRFHPDVSVGDVVRLHYPAQNLMDTYTVKSQSITLGGGCRVSEVVQK